MIRRLTLALLAAAPLPALANDSTAELGTGGLIMSRNDVIYMEKENLRIAEDGVEVDYVFRNHSDEDITSIVAFPMPDVEGNPWWMPAIPDDSHDNFLGFEVNIGGKPVQANLEQRAFAVGIDVTADLAKQGIPLFPYGEDAYLALESLPDAIAMDWRERGIIMVEQWDDGSGMKSYRSPYWQLKSTYWWEAAFPAKSTVEVSHRYKPSVGATAGLTFFYDGKFQGESWEQYEAKYCIDEPFKRAVLKAAKANPDGYPELYENRISYVLTTGGNWGGGTIGDFTLTIDKGSTKNLVSFCGAGVKKIGPTTFQMKATDYYPARDVDVLILKPYDWDDEAASASRSADVTRPETPAERFGKRPAAPNAPEPPAASSMAPSSGAGDGGQE
ncbi:MAG: DUF4424 family protein [Rhizobiaceae bacterium]